MALSILEHVPLNSRNTFKVGGPARYFCEVTNEDELCEAIDFSKQKKIVFFILGGGSNILISDDGFQGLVIKIAIKTMFIDDIDGDHVEVTVGAGESWDSFVTRMVVASLYGVENLSGIPGTVGAAPVQNIGAYGSEVQSAIQSVRAYDVREGVFVELMNADCQFAYRDSIFKKNPGRYVVTSVIFVLKKEGTVNIGYKDLREFFQDKISANENYVPDISEVRVAVLDIRSRKLPNVFKADAVGTAGSFFKNPIVPAVHFAKLQKQFPEIPSYPAGEGRVKIPLAWVLDHVCGYRGARKGNVGTYANQALVIVNTGNATATEIKNFANDIVAIVKEKTDIDIEPEVQYVG